MLMLSGFAPADVLFYFEIPFVFDLLTSHVSPVCDCVSSSFVLVCLSLYLCPTCEFIPVHSSSRVPVSS